MATPRVSPLFVCILLTLAAACRDEQAGPRQRKTGASARPGTGGVQTLEAAPSDLTFRSGASWGQGGPQYLGAKVSPADARAGQSVTVSHYFIARTPPPRGWGYFVHAVDAESGQMVANLDHPLQEGRAPAGGLAAGQGDRGSPHLHRAAESEWPGAPDARLLARRPAVADRRPRGRRRRSAHEGPGPRRRRGGALPEYHVARAPPDRRRSTGVIDPAEWAASTPVQLVGSFDGRPPQVRTLARLLWDDAHLYVAFDAEDRDVWGTLREHDAKIYEEEVVEIFLDANADGRTYNELQVRPAQRPVRRLLPGAAHGDGPHLAVGDAERGQGGRDAGRRLGSGSRLDGGDEDPLREPRRGPRVPPAAGDRWRFNLYRLEHHERGKNIEGRPSRRSSSATSTPCRASAGSASRASPSHALRP